jgi:hypothetical protein
MAKHLSILNSDILKVCLNLSLFLIIFFLINTGLSIILDHIYFSSQGGNSGAQINYVLKQRSPILIFGASRAMHHYIPQIIEAETGFKTFNAGDDGKNASYQLGLLEMLLTRYKPKLIIYDVGDYTASLDGGTVDLYPYYYQYPQVEDILDKRDEYAPYKFKFHLYAYNQKIFSIILGYIRKSKPNITGYHPLSGSIRPEEIKVYQENLGTVAEPQIDSVAFHNFSRFIELCKENHIQLVMVYSPRMFQQNFKYLSYVDTLANRYHVPYLNYTGDAHFLNHRELFQDIEHLNNRGAELFSEEMGEDLLKYMKNDK